MHELRGLGKGKKDNEVLPQLRRENGFGGVTMFGLISKKKLVEILKELNKNNDTAKANGVNDFYFRCGVANAVNYICHKFKFDYYAQEDIDNDQT